MRQGLTSDRTGFSKRLFRLRQGTLPSVVLLLMPDEVRLRHARRLLLSASVPALLGLEQDAASCRPADPVWRPPSVAAILDLRYVLSRLERGGPMPSEPAPSRASLPADIAVEGDGLSLPDHMLPAILKPTEKRCIDLLSDWPWLTLVDLSGLLGVSGPRVSQLVTRLEALGLAIRTVVAGRRRIALTDRGLALLARRDRASLSTAKKRWGVTPLDPEVPPIGAASPEGEAANCSGTSSTPKRCMGSSRRWPPSTAPRVGRRSSSTRPEGRRATSGTTASSTRSALTPSAF